MGYSWTARGTGCGKKHRHYERGYWQDYFRSRIQCCLPQGRHEVHQGMGRPDAQDGLLGDMTDPYITYDNRYIETLWWLAETAL